MPQVQGCLGFVLIIVEPMAGGCVAHTVARPGEDAGSALETVHAAPEVELRPYKRPIVLLVTFR